MFVTPAKRRVTISAVDNAVVVVVACFDIIISTFSTKRKRSGYLIFRKIARTNTNMIGMHEICTCDRPRTYFLFISVKCDWLRQRIVIMISAAQIHYHAIHCVPVNE